MQTKYTDKDGNEFELRPYPYRKNQHACVGCAFKFGNSNACVAAPTCTPEELGYRTSPETEGRYVWRRKDSPTWQEEKA